MKGLTTGDDDPIVILNSTEDLKRHPVMKVDACDIPILDCRHASKNV